ncbi:hypothetical protein [Spiroplasma endosymbiont of Lariophagus distinguendus]|uniref:hypothetical protein n=1 Tax=Spiroplasma endosymbiont of Lariophagus distinguendus TaxID=2935082 RepID=UPI002079CE8E|nr:hypothetical protein [Spiroplasma endosymbiont of Lariophagus distinguendus]
MPIETKNGIKNKILERVENTAAFSKENSKVKDKRFTTDMIPNMYCEKKLVEAFRKEAKEKKWLCTTLMNEILRERYGKGNKKNEND